MNKLLVILFAVLGFVLGFLGAEAHASEVVSKKDNVKVYAEASKSASVVMTLKKGDAVAASERKGMFWKVIAPGNKVGFVSVLDVKRGSVENSSLSKAIRAATQANREEDAAVVSVRSRSSVMGVRGLDESEETSFAGNVKPNLSLVYAMEDRRLPKAKIERLGDLINKEVERRYARAER